MSKNPVLIPRPFAVNGSKNSIHDTRQAGQDPEDATWSDGFPNVTMQPVESGGLPPKGMDFNGIFNALSDTAVHLQKGGFFYFDQSYSAAFSGYQKGAILIADDNARLFISTSDNNTNNPNQNTKGWMILAGVGVNADTATKLQATCKINGVEFDGSTDINATPAGAVQYFAMDSAPVGWLKANGATVSRTLYANLFAAIGTRFGSGDGKTTFNLPDLRGEFLRGWDDGRGLDANRDIGTVQRYQIVNHTHELQGWTGLPEMLVGKRTRFLGIGGIAVTLGDGGVLYSDKVGIDVDPAYRMIGTLGVYNNLDAGSENRPRNISLLACIKT